MTNQAQIEGVKLTLRGREFLVHPLGIKALRKLTKRVGTLADLGGGAAFEAWFRCQTGEGPDPA